MQPIRVKCKKKPEDAATPAGRVKYIQRSLRKIVCFIHTAVAVKVSYAGNGTPDRYVQVGVLYVWAAVLVCKDSAREDISGGSGVPGASWAV